MNPARRFVIWFFLITTIASLCYLGLFRLQHGSPVKAEWWVKHIYDYKQNFAASMTSPKAILLAGSSGLFGFDSPLFEKKTGLKTVNLSVHAGLDSRFFYHQLEQVLGKGDVVVMPLEYEHYTTEPAQTHWFVSNMLAWGNDIYVDKLSVPEYLEFVSRVPPSRLWEGLAAMNLPRKQLDSRVVRKEVLEANRKGPARFNGYSHTSLNLQGDIQVRSRPLQYGIDMVRKVAVEEGHPFIEMPSEISHSFLDNYRNIQDLAQDREATIMLAWPVSIRNHQFDFKLKETRERFVAFNALLESHDIKVQCDPVLFNLHAAFFYDNRYHLNALGGQLRTHNLAECMNAYLDGKTAQPYDFDSSLIKRQQQEAQLLKKRTPRKTEKGAS